jgi:hypothetical protein
MELTSEVRRIVAAERALANDGKAAIVHSGNLGP